MHERYEQLKRESIRGWQTWNVNSVLSHVLMPEGLALNLCVQEYAVGRYLKEALIGRFEADAEQVFPGPHAWDGSYTALDISWRGLSFTVESTNAGGELVLLATPKELPFRAPTLVLEGGLLWNRPGALSLSEGGMAAALPGGEVRVYASATPVAEPMNLPTQACYLAVPFDGPVVFSTGRRMEPAAARALLDKRRAALTDRWQIYGENAPLYEAMQCALAWDTVYDAKNDRLISPVSRLWSVNAGGYVLFCWDNYFAGFMASFGSPALACSNLVEITREQVPAGFVPNAAWGNGYTSLDRSQPPVGSAMVLETWRRLGDRWLLEALYPRLLEWNRWFAAHRMNPSGALCWGSEAYEPRVGGYWETEGVHSRYGAALESGLDNSPMYDDIPFDAAANRLMLEDVGLTGLYILDCDALIEIGGILGDDSGPDELRRRKALAQRGLEGLWDEANGFYYNRRTDTGEFSRRVSPTNFYALFSDSVSPERARRMIDEHYRNPEEFYGQYMLPSIARNDPAYPCQDYWRGRVWAPMNFLVYMAMRRHGLDDACADLAAKSRDLLMREWLEHGHIHENYNADTGSGCDVQNSDKFYHWGALLALVAMLEAGVDPEFDGGKGRFTHD